MTTKKNSEPTPWREPRVPRWRIVATIAFWIAWAVAWAVTGLTTHATGWLIVAFVATSAVIAGAVTWIRTARQIDVDADREAELDHD